MTTFREEIARMIKFYHNQDTTYIEDADRIIGLFEKLINELSKQGESDECMGKDIYSSGQSGEDYLNGFDRAFTLMREEINKK